jgi:NADP-dependent 3-hydroxy acid dehydrogenase YdfG
VHLLCNNAGVGAGSTVWESTINDWKWVIGVNVWGVIHGLRVFLPIMLEQDSEGHIVNTASIAGMISYHRSAAYHLSKHAIVALSEKLFHDLAARGSKIRVSVLCPGWVRTGIMDSMRNRPAALRDNAPEIVITPEMKEAMEQYRRACEAGIPPANVADHVFQAVRDEKFYIFTHPEYAPLMKERLEAVLQQRNPTEPARLQALLGQ